MNRVSALTLLAAIIAFELWLGIAFVRAHHRFPHGGGELANWAIGWE